MHYETILRLYRIAREANRIGVIIAYGRVYKFGMVIFKNNVYEANVIPNMFTKNEIESNKIGLYRCADGYLIYGEQLSLTKIVKHKEKDINQAIEYIFKTLGVTLNARGEFTDLKNIKEITNYLIKGKLDYLIFDGDVVLEKNKN